MTAFSFTPIASPLHSQDELATILAPCFDLLRAAGGTPAYMPSSGLAAPASSEPLVLFIQTGGTERQALDLLDLTPPYVPLLLLAHPAHNSLPASLEILARCRQLHRHARLHFIRPGGASAADASPLAPFLADYAAASAALALRTAHIGRLGASSDWLVASSHAPDLVARRFGATLDPIPLDDLKAAYANTPLPDDGPEFELYRTATATPGVPREAFADAVRLSRALAGLAADHHLSALTIRCFDLLASPAVTGCLALALLADAGIPCACEGDIPSTLGLLWVRLLTGRPAWMANPSDIDPDAGRALLAHCTIPFSLTTSHALKTHFESGLSVAIDGTLPTGPCSVLRIGGADLDLADAFDATLLASHHRPGLCRTQAEISLPSPAARHWLDAPLGNHVILSPSPIAALFLTSFSFTLPPQ